MNDIMIVGNSGAARECLELLQDCLWNSPTLRYEIRFGGFLSFKGYPGDLGPLQAEFKGDLDDWQIREKDRFIIGIGMPALRRQVFAELKTRGARFINLISRWSYLPPDFALGEGNIVNSHCVFSGASRAGDGNYFNGSVRLGHDVTIGSFNFFAPSTTVLGAATIGDGNLIAVQSVVLEHAKVGSHNHIAPGSIIYKGCRDNCRMAGNPALKIGDMEHG